MGNKLARTTQASASEYYLHDLPSTRLNLVLKEVLGNDRFFKCIQCVHDEGLLIVKVYFKRGETNLKEHGAKLLELQNRLQNVEDSHVRPFQDWYETDKAAYLLRQHFYSNLHDRISTRPFLSTIERKWITFQLLHAVKQCHDNGVCHGDIKCENVVMTSWNWIYLTDFQPFKPTYMPDDNPADFSFYFDTGGRRRCYVAPERFVDPTLGIVEGTLLPSMDMFSLGCVIAELFMDGQVLFDLSKLHQYRKQAWDPRPVVEKQISDVGIRNMILQMIHLTPESRLSPDAYLETWGYDVFPKYFPALHKLFALLTGSETDTRVQAIQETFPELRKQIISDAKSAELLDVLDKGGGISEGSEKNPKPSARPTPKHDLVNDITSLLKEENHGIRQQTNKQGSKNGAAPRGRAYRRKAAAIAIEEAAGSTEDVVIEKVFENNTRDADGAFGDNVVYTVDCTAITGTCRRKEDLGLPPEGAWAWEGDWMVDFGWFPVDTEGWRYCNSDVSDSYKPKQWWTSIGRPDCFWRQRLWTRTRRRVSEGTTRVSKDVKSEGMVLVASLLTSCLRNVKLPHTKRAAVQLLNEASVLCDDDARLQLIVPYVASVLSDSAAIVRCAALEALCDVLSRVESFPQSDAKVFPEYIFPLLSKLPDDPEETVRITYASCISKFATTGCRFLDLQYAENARAGTKYELELGHLRETIGRIIHDLVMGPKQTPLIRRALLENVWPLCKFFGTKHCNDFLLPILPAFLNDRDKLLRGMFFEQIVYVCVYVGQLSCEAYLLPYLEQATSNVEETEVVNAVECLTAVALLRLLKKRPLLRTLERVVPLLCHPSQFVRRATVTFVAGCGTTLDHAEASAHIWPMVSPLMKREPVSLSSEAALLACLKPPLTREFFQRVLSEEQRSPSTSPRSKTAKNHRYNGGDDMKMRAMQGYIQNLSSTMHSWDTEHPEKKSETGAGFFSAADVSTDGIPLYSVAVSEKSEDWSRVPRQGPFESLISSQWAAVPPPESSGVDFLQKSTLTLPPRLSTSIYGGARRGIVNEAGTAVSVLASKSRMNFDPPMSTHRGPVSEQTGEPSSSLAFVKYLKSVASSADICWKPRGVLVAHLEEHNGPVNEVAVSGDGTFFASGSDDGAVNIWDCRRLERDISFRSRLRYSFPSGRVLRLAMLDPTDYQVAAASSGGDIHVFCVDYTARVGNTVERYSGLSNVRKLEAQEGPVQTLQAFSPSGGAPKMLLYTAQRSVIHLWDLRTRADAWMLKAKPEHGVITGVAIDPACKWLVSGTSRGVMTLWDVRYQVAAFSWQLPRPYNVEVVTSACSSSPPRPFVYVVAGRDEIGIWNAENGVCQQVLRSAVKDEAGLPSAVQQLPGPANLNYKLDDVINPPMRFPGARSLLPLANGAAVISGSTDCKIRLWDNLRPECSYVMCGPSAKGLKSAAHFVPKNVSGVNVTQEVLSAVSGSSRKHTNTTAAAASGPALAATDTVGCPQDAVTSLALASPQPNLQLLISSSRDGVIKVWK